MKKQGAPEPLSEEHFANLKRKKGLPVDEVPAEVPSSKKRRTSAKPDKATKRRLEEDPSRNDTTSRPAAKQANGTKKASGAVENGRKAAKPKAKAAPEPQSDSDKEMDDEFGASDLDDASGSGLDGAKLGDDFLDSDDSVYDSDQEGAKKEKFVFSDDEEDDEDREERLTAANIEGLSKKLDERMAREAEENEEELRQALQTNIDGDKPRILGDEDEEDELSSKAKGLLAPDLQMLRTRITETIRVLEDFTNLAEEGRSRTEYTNQLLKDVCACMTCPHALVKFLRLGYSR
jgi:ribosomal RNA methyltransferase Nop2